MIDATLSIGAILGGVMILFSTGHMMKVDFQEGYDMATGSVLVGVVTGICAILAGIKCW